MQTQVTDYEKHATDFLKSVGAKLKIEYIEHDFYFPDDKQCRDIYRFTLSRAGRSYTAKFGQSIANTGETPTAYDILACITKYEPGTLEDFCADFGYDSDSRKVEKIYDAVVKEFAGVQRVFGDVIEQLQEIQ